MGQRPVTRSWISSEHAIHCVSNFGRNSVDPQGFHWDTVGTAGFAAGSLLGELHHFGLRHRPQEEVIFRGKRRLWGQGEVGRQHRRGTIQDSSEEVAQFVPPLLCSVAGEVQRRPLFPSCQGSDGGPNRSALCVVTCSVDLADGLVYSSLLPLVQEAGERLFSFLGGLAASAETLDLPPSFVDLLHEMLLHIFMNRIGEISLSRNVIQIEFIRLV